MLLLIIFAVSRGKNHRSDANSSNNSSSQERARSAQQTENGENAPPPNAAQIGQPVRNRLFEVTVKKAKIASSYSDDLQTHNAPEGVQFVILDVVFKNITDSPQQIMCETDTRGMVPSDYLHLNQTVYKICEVNVSQIEQSSALQMGMNPNIPIQVRRVWKIPSGTSGTLYYQIPGSDDLVRVGDVR